MGNKFFEIDDRAALESLMTDSKQKPVIVFKHSNACSISSRAYREMEKVEADVNILVVQSRAGCLPRTREPDWCATRDSTGHRFARRKSSLERFALRRPGGRRC